MFSRRLVNLFLFFVLLSSGQYFAFADSKGPDIKKLCDAITGGDRSAAGDKACAAAMKGELKLNIFKDENRTTAGSDMGKKGGDGKTCSKEDGKQYPDDLGKLGIDYITSQPTKSVQDVYIETRAAQGGQILVTATAGLVPPPGGIISSAGATLNGPGLFPIATTNILLASSFANSTTALTGVLQPMGLAPLASTSGIATSIFPNSPATGLGLNCNFSSIPVTILAQTIILNAKTPALNGATQLFNCSSYPTVVSAITAAMGSSSIKPGGQIEVTCNNGNFEITGMSCAAIDPGVCGYRITAGSLAEPPTVTTTNFSFAAGPFLNCPTLGGTANPSGYCSSFVGSPGPLLASATAANASYTVGGLTITTGTSFDSAKCKTFSSYFCHPASSVGPACDAVLNTTTGSIDFSPINCNLGYCSGQNADGVFDAALGRAYLTCPSSSPCGSFLGYLSSYATTGTGVYNLVYQKVPVISVDATQTNTCSTAIMEPGDSCVYSVIGGMLPYTVQNAKPYLSTDPSFTCAITNNVITATLLPGANPGAAAYSGKFANCLVADSSGNSLVLPDINVFGFDLHFAQASYEIGAQYVMAAQAPLSSADGVSGLIIVAGTNVVLPATSPGCTVSSLVAGVVQCQFNAVNGALTIAPWGPTLGAASITVCLGVHSCVTNSTLTTSAAALNAWTGLPSAVDLGVYYTYSWATKKAPWISGVFSQNLMTSTSTPYALDSSLAVVNPSNIALWGVAPASGDLTIKTQATAGAFTISQTVNGYTTTSPSISAGQNLISFTPSSATPLIQAFGGMTLNIPDTLGYITPAITCAVNPSTAGSVVCPSTLSTGGTFSFKPVEPPQSFQIDVTFNGVATVSSSVMNSQYDMSTVLLPKGMELGNTYKVPIKLGNLPAASFPALTCTVGAPPTPGSLAGAANCVVSGSFITLTPTSLGATTQGLSPASTPAVGVTICAGGGATPTCTTPTQVSLYLPKFTQTATSTYFEQNLPVGKMSFLANNNATLGLPTNTVVSPLWNSFSCISVSGNNVDSCSFDPVTATHPVNAIANSSLSVGGMFICPLALGASSTNPATGSVSANVLDCVTILNGTNGTAVSVLSGLVMTSDAAGMYNGGSVYSMDLAPTGTGVTAFPSGVTFTAVMNSTCTGASVVSTDLVLGSTPSVTPTSVLASFSLTTSATPSNADKFCVDVVMTSASGTTFTQTLPQGSTFSILKLKLSMTVLAKTNLTPASNAWAGGTVVVSDAGGNSTSSIVVGLDQSIKNGNYQVKIGGNTLANGSSFTCNKTVAYTAGNKMPDGSAPTFVITSADATTGVVSGNLHVVGSASPAKSLDVSLTGSYTSTPAGMALAGGSVAITGGKFTVSNDNPLSGTSGALTYTQVAGTTFSSANWSTTVNLPGDLTNGAMTGASLSGASLTTSAPASASVTGINTSTTPLVVNNGVVGGVNIDAASLTNCSCNPSNQLICPSPGTSLTSFAGGSLSSGDLALSGLGSSPTLSGSVSGSINAGAVNGTVSSGAVAGAAVVGNAVTNLALTGGQITSSTTQPGGVLVAGSLSVGGGAYNVTNVTTNLAPNLSCNTSGLVCGGGATLSGTAVCTLSSASLSLNVDPATLFSGSIASGAQLTGISATSANVTGAASTGVTMPATVTYKVTGLVPLASSTVAPACDLASWTAAAAPASVDMGCNPVGNTTFGGSANISLSGGAATITGTGFGTAISKFSCSSNKYDAPQIRINLPTKTKNTWTPQSDLFDVEICVNGSTNCIVQTISY